MNGCVPVRVLNKGKWKRLCVICGAEVRNANPKTATCSSRCTRARDEGLETLEQLERFDAIVARRHDCFTCACDSCFSYRAGQMPDEPDEVGKLD